MLGNNPFPENPSRGGEFYPAQGLDPESVRGALLIDEERKRQAEVIESAIEAFEKSDLYQKSKKELELKKPNK